MHYQTFEPQQDLTPLIKCYWTLESPKEISPGKQTIVPDGCMEMIFHYGDPYLQYTDQDQHFLQPRCFVIGQLTRPLEIEPTGETGIFSVRFHPDGFIPWATRPIKEMENTPLSLDLLFGNEGRMIEAQMLEATSTAQRIERIEAFLMHTMMETSAIDRMVKSAVDILLTANGQISVQSLSLQTNINRRQLERRFSSAIGLSPKQLAKTIRFINTLRMLLNNPSTSLTTVAYANAYYDQAHFNKDFKALTGLTPGEFYKDNLKMSAIFYSAD